MVTGTCSPASVKTRVIPSFCAIRPDRIALPRQSFSELDLNIDTGRKVELHQSIDGLRGRVDDVDQPFMGTHLELFTTLLVDMRRPIDSELLDPRGQRDGPAHFGAGPLGGVHDFPRRSVEHSVIEGFEADADILALHSP